MHCYNCGCNLTEHDFCPNCRADVSQYKKVIYISNRFYNEGLEKAHVRDLTGAISSLRQCLKFNKNNIEARNLLGLVYFETGEVVAALSEWVISQNIRPKQNIANDYIEMLQSNPSRLDTINQTIKKYNQALTYTQQNSEDLAIINLKKVIALNGKFIRARHLLALLYISSERWEEAKTQLIECAKIDTGNTTTKRYRKEVDEMLMPVEGTRNKRKKNTSDDVVKYVSGNELVIQPVNNHENRGFAVLVNLSLGVLIGIACAWFLVMPARVAKSVQDAEDKVVAANEQLDVKTADIEDLKSQLEKAQNQVVSLKEELDSYEGSDGARSSIYSLIQAAESYLSQPEDVTVVADYLDGVDANQLGEDSSEAPYQLYNTLMLLAGPELAEGFYNVGYESYNSGDYEVAIENLSRAYQYDQTNGDALYYLAQAYNRSGDETKAIETYKMVVDAFPGTEKAAKSADYLEQLTGSAE